MQDEQNTEARWRQLGEQARALANLADDPKVRQVMLEADKYDLLAERAKHAAEQQEPPPDTK